MDSRGSGIPDFIAQPSTGRLFIMDRRMTRVLLTHEQAVRMVMCALQLTQGVEIFVPKIPSVRITDLALVIGPHCALHEIGIRPGEKLHETLITEEEARMTSSSKIISSS